MSSQILKRTYARSQIVIMSSYNFLLVPRGLITNSPATDSRHGGTVLSVVLRNQAFKIGRDIFKNMVLISHSQISK